MAPRSSRASGANTDTDTSMADASEIRQLPVDPMVSPPTTERPSSSLLCFAPMPISTGANTYSQDVDETPDFTEDSDTNPNTTASSVAGDPQTADGRKRRSEATLLRRSVFGKKHDVLGESKV